MLKHYLDIASLAECLTVKRSTLYSWAERGFIPYLKIGRLLRFDPEEIDRWLESQRRDSTYEPPATHRRSSSHDIDAIIALAKREAYTAGRGKPDQDRATRKERKHGSV